MLVTFDVGPADLLGDVAVEVLGGDDGDGAGRGASGGHGQQSREERHGGEGMLRELMGVAGGLEG